MDDLATVEKQLDEAFALFDRMAKDVDSLPDAERAERHKALIGLMFAIGCIGRDWDRLIAAGMFE